MKIISWLLGIVVSVFVLVYVVAFTGFGNSLLAPIIEKKIQEQTKLPSRLEQFHLSMDDFKILLSLNQNNTVALQGSYSLFAQSFNIEYAIKLEELKTLKQLTQTQLQSSFHTDGKVVGDMAFLKIDGESDLAKSNTSYHVELTDLNPTSIIASVDQLDLNALLFMLNQKAYASAKVNVNVNFKDITPHHLNGKITLLTKEGKLNAAVMQKDFGVTMPTTAFSMNLLANLQGDNVEYKYMLHSNLAQISSSGVVVPQPLKTDIKYGIDIKELAVLKPLSGADIRGPLRLSGTLKGTKAKLIVDGKTNIAASKTNFSALLKEFQPATLNATISGLKLQKLLYMLKQPHYADGTLNLKVDMSSLDSNNLQGELISSITQGVLDTPYLTKQYEFKSMMPHTSFSTKTVSKIDKNRVDTKLSIHSTLADLSVKNAQFNIKDASLTSDYKAKIKDLNKLFFVTQRALKGSIVANGTIKKSKDLDITMVSDVAGGRVDATLHNDDLVANINRLETLQVLDMLLYPQVFKSKVDGKLVYNLATQKGNFDGKLSDGLFTNNQVLDLVKQYANIDLYKQRFKGDVNSQLNKEHIKASLDLRSNTSSIVTKNTKINSKTQQIQSKIDINANSNPLSVTLSGNVARPKVKIDASKIIQKQAEKAAKKEVNKFLKKFF
jgi:hypothetical protein